MAVSVRTVLGGFVVSVLLSSCGADDLAPGATQPSAQPIVWEEHLAGLAKSLGIESPPDVQAVRTVSPSESQEVVDACLAEEGWMQGEDGWVTVPEDQFEASNLSIYICTAQYPINPDFLSPLTEGQFARLYDHWISDTLPCAQGYGVVIDSDLIPSKEVFLENPYAWTPFSALMPQLVQMEESGQISSVDSFLAETCPGPDEWELRDLERPDE